MWVTGQGQQLAGQNLQLGGSGARQVARGGPDPRQSGEAGAPQLAHGLRPWSFDLSAQDQRKCRPGEALSRARVDNGLVTGIEQGLEQLGIAGGDRGPAGLEDLSAAVECHAAAAQRVDGPVVDGLRKIGHAGERLAPVTWVAA